MKIPPDALIPEGKLTRYLLVPRKSGDKSKFLARGGFNLTTSALLEREIRRLAADREAIADRVNENGIYYNVSGSLAGPSGIELPVKLVWLHRLDDVFTFVTLVPLTGS
jgi:hypothetical protein